MAMDLTKDALIGAKRADPIAMDNAATQAVVDQHDQRAAQLLTAAAIQTVGQIASYQLQQLPSESSFYEDHDPRVFMTDAAAWHLQIMLNGKFTLSLAEFLTELHVRNLRMPALHIPQLLERARINTKIRPLLFKVLSPAERDIASYNGYWAYARQSQLDYRTVRNQWENLTSTERIAIIGQARALDPELGLHLLEAAWPTEISLHRSRMLTHLKTGLSMKDEPFLERALNTRDTAPRVKIYELLSSLPKSRYSQRASSVLSQAMLSTRTIQIDFGALESPSAQRDGFAVGNTPKLAQSRSRHLQRLISATPLQFWDDYFSQSPKGILALAAASKWPQSIRNGLARAAQYQQNDRWADAILRYSQIDNNTVSLINVLSPAAAEALIRDQLPKSVSHMIMDQQPATLLMRRYSGPWSDALVRTLLNGVVALLDADLPVAQKTRETIGRDLLKKCVNNCNAELAPEFSQTLLPYSRQTSDWQLSLNNALRTIHFRRDMLRALEGQTL